MEKDVMGGACSTCRSVYMVLWRNLRERDRLGDLGVDRRIILIWIFRKRDVGLWAGSSWLRKGTDGWYL